MFLNSKLVLRFFCFSSFCGLFLCQTSCPDPADLAPFCSCSFDLSSSETTLDCSGVEDESQLEMIFTSASFPTLNVNRLQITGNRALKYLTRNVFGDVFFEYLTFYDNVLEYISDSVFVNSNSTLKQWEVRDCKMSNSQGFPFYSLHLFTELSVLNLGGAGKFDVLPKIASTSLISLNVDHCQIQFIPSGVFNGLPNLEELILRHNSIPSIGPGYFDQNPWLNYISFGGNLIKKLGIGTFRNLTNLEEIDLFSNKIIQIEAGAFFNLPKLRTLVLDDNELQNFYVKNLGYLPSLTDLVVTRNHINFLESHLFIGSPALQVVEIYGNDLTSIVPGVFDDIFAAFLNLGSNQLTTLDETWLRSPLTNLNYVTIYSNPLTCGCDMAWLYTEPNLMVRLEADCNNGTDVHSLDPSFFNTNC